MHVVLLTPELLSFGGIQRQNRLVIAALDELLYAMDGSLEVLSLNDSLPELLPSELACLQVTTITYFGGNRLSYMRRFLRKSHRADLVVYGLLGLTLMSLTAVLINNSSRRLLMLYGIEAWNRRSPLHGLAVRTMHGYISISKYTLDRFGQAYHINANKFSFILPNVVSPDLLQTVYPATQLNQRAGPKLLTVSGMRSHDQLKGIDTVLRALPNLLSHFPNLRYSIIGDGSDRQRLEDLSHELGVENNVDFLGNVADSELKEAYGSCDVFVLPSAKEGFGFVFIEAMAYSKPVVAARAGATPEVVIDKETGVLIDYDDHIQLASALTDLFNNVDKRRKMGEAGKRNVEALFSYQALKSNLFKALFA